MVNERKEVVVNNDGIFVDGQKVETETLHNWTLREYIGECESLVYASPTPDLPSFLLFYSTVRRGGAATISKDFFSKLQRYLIFIGETVTENGDTVTIRKMIERKELFTFAVPDWRPVTVGDEVIPPPPQPTLYSIKVFGTTDFSETVIEGTDWFVLTTDPFVNPDENPYGNQQVAIPLFHTVFTRRCRGVFVFPPVGEFAAQLWKGSFPLVTLPTHETNFVLPHVPVVKRFKFLLKTTNERVIKLCRTVGDFVEDVHETVGLDFPPILVTDQWTEEMSVLPVPKIFVGVPPTGASVDGILYENPYEIFQYDDEVLPFYLPRTVLIWEEMDWAPPPSERPDRVFLATSPYWLSKETLSVLKELNDLYEVVDVEEAVSWDEKQVKSYRWGILLADNALSPIGEHPLAPLCARYGTPLLLTRFFTSVVYPLTALLSIPDDPKTLLAYLRGVRFSFHQIEPFLYSVFTVRKFHPVAFADFLESVINKVEGGMRL